MAVSEAPDAAPVPVQQPTVRDRLLLPLHRWIWADPGRRARKLLRFAETEADGGRDLTRAAELTSDARLRRLYLRHALDEYRHADLFRRRGTQILHDLPRAGAAGSEGGLQANWLAPGERGLDDLQVDREKEDSLLAFLHLSERAAAHRFEVYRRVLDTDPETRAVFADILRDEAFHMNYTYAQLKRVAPAHYGRRLWRARASRLWKGYLRLAVALAGLLGGLLLFVQYFVILPVFALLARRAAEREQGGWSTPMSRVPERALRKQY